LTEHTNNTGALVNSTTHKNLGKERGQTEPGLVVFYDIRPGNGLGLFFQPRSSHGLNTVAEVFVTTSITMLHKLQKLHSNLSVDVESSILKQVTNGSRLTSLGCQVNQRHAVRCLTKYATLITPERNSSKRKCPYNDRTIIAVIHCGPDTMNKHGCSQLGVGLLVVTT